MCVWPRPSCRHDDRHVFTGRRPSAETVERCGCRKAGMKCSVVCFHCSGETCSNVMELSELINENDFDDEPPTLTPLPSPVLPLVFNSETRLDAEPQPGPSKRLRTE
ncbi:hypothetical protein EVAR_2794_1 [Eumeta japonica]|uniref:Uncharacterized protein n=1 Tax=Eumeta variegata TaxID=151549 RepID=A0A4C1SZQ3_EUMVA|nr:hypothetical protein EVAR_2794_1 [Eumeta japonica]